MPTQAPTAGQSSSWPLELRYKAMRSTRLSVHAHWEFGTRIAENGALCQAEQLVAAYDGNVRKQRRGAKARVPRLRYSELATDNWFFISPLLHVPSESLLRPRWRFPTLDLCCKNVERSARRLSAANRPKCRD